MKFHLIEKIEKIYEETLDPCEFWIIEKYLENILSSGVKCTLDGRCLYLCIQRIYFEYVHNLYRTQDSKNNCQNSNG